MYLVSLVEGGLYPKIVEPLRGGLPFLIIPERGREEAAGAGNEKIGFIKK